MAIALKAAWLDTPLGSMLAVSDEEALYLLEFNDRCGLESELERLRSKTHATIVFGSSKPIESITKELAAYFSGHLKQFKTPLHIMGTDFQKSAWKILQDVPYGHTRSYLEQAREMGNKSACRAVANANGANQLAIVIPCHRIIQSNGTLGGYGAGIARKKWLLDFEKQH
jgi:AraC family transcriptional regulator, regulatory protein of adaptative response / methylated-DNA-[protein]-cysteine methyltransferase